MAIQSPSSSSSFSYGFTYQVFLSFRGSDTRNGFTGHLYKALDDKGIHTFIDDYDLKRGDEITPSLVKAIEESRIFIPVFSINYASSSFCLDELVHIIHCSKTNSRLVLPVFYGVDPTNVRHHTCSYGEDLTKHEERFQNNKKNMERLHQWKMALTQAANLSGYHYSPGYEYKFIEKIVEDISDRINRVSLHVAKYPVGLQSRVQHVKLLLDKGSEDEVHMVGLYGTGGLGKSTLAKAIYNFIADKFEGLCFLGDVRENSTPRNLKDLQEKLLLKMVRLDIKLGSVGEGIAIIKQRLCRKKILLILDDVDRLEQLEALAGGLDWFGRGSRVIVTTRDKHILTCHGIESTYAVEGMYGAEALKLLKWMAFKNDKVPSIYEDIFTRAITYAAGLPLALVIIGSNLFGKSIEEWKCALDEYEKIPNKEIQKILRVSYDALEEKEQSVFLDIACFFKGWKWAEVKNILHDHYGHCINYHLGKLAEKSLINISTIYSLGYIDDETLHNLIEHMGKEVVRQESRNNPGERSRLWRHDDIVQVLKESTGTSKIEMIYMNFPSMEFEIDWNGEAFKKTTKLKTLIIKNGQFSKGPKYLPSSLRVLKWKGCPSESLSSCFLNKKFENMKALTFNDCEFLTNIPDVSGLPNLEKFSIVNCKNLVTIHNSIGYLSKLEILSAEGCRKLKSFPPLRLPSLKTLELSNCRSLKSFPELLCKMKNMKELSLFQTPIGELPFSFQNLSELRDLTIYQDGILRFSSNIFMMPKLSKITAEGCRLLLPKHNDKMNSMGFSNVENIRLTKNNLSDECLPILLKWCTNVKWLDLSGDNLKILPECLNECHLMKILKLDGCNSLEEIRGIPPNLNYLSAMRCKSLSSSSRRMLLSQQLHEAGCTEICLPNRNEGIPDWFEHQIRGRTISFWFRKEIPSISCIVLLCHPKPSFLQDTDRNKLRVNLFVNGYEYTLSDYLWHGCSLLNLRSENTFLFDLKLAENTNYYNLIHKKLVSELDHALFKNKWIHVEIQIESCPEVSHRDDHKKMKLLCSTQIGIHVFKKKRNMEEDVIFTSRYGKRKLDEYLNTSISKFDVLLKKQRSVDVEVYEIKLVQQQQNCMALSSLIPIGLQLMASLLAWLQTVSFVLIVFSFVVLFWRIAYHLFFL